MIYLDTSVIVAYYCPEALSLQVQDLLREQAKPALSFLTEVEFTSAVAKKVRLNELGSVDANRILAKFTSHVDAGLFRIIPVENHHYQLARGWIGLLTTPLRTLDALHLAIASSEELQLVTSDKSFFQAARMLDLDARLIA
ncbi:MAG: type II toxin-antitoxin system VapC family toxin [Desulfobacterales bacterium]|nr:type II toxin-antitoxin system VapC family toxin [Pseudomonadota bacterium]MCG2777992.1 type II toxin-antitoxin system VapC family toxin [Desulfobacterales bacterium]